MPEARRLWPRLGGGGLGIEGFLEGRGDGVMDGVVGVGVLEGEEGGGGGCFYRVDNSTFEYILEKRIETSRPFFLFFSPLWCFQHIFYGWTKKEEGRSLLRGISQICPHTRVQNRVF